MLGWRKTVPTLAPQTRRWLATTVLSPTITVSTLPNGFKVFSDLTPGFFTQMGVFVSSGSRLEPSAGTRGLTHATARLAFKLTLEFSTEQVLERLRRHGGVYDCVYDREYMAYNASVMNRPQEVEDMFAVLAATVRDPLVQESEVEEVRQIVEYERVGMELTPEQMLPEISFATAYAGKSLGAPLTCPADAEITRESILRFRAAFIQPLNLLAGFSGVDHETAVRLAERYFGDMQQTGAVPAKDTPVYVGGEVLLPLPALYGRDEEKNYLRLLFEAVASTLPDLYAVAVLQLLIGQARSFSAGGPGKGLYARLMMQVLARNLYMDLFSADGFVFSDTGMMLVTAACWPERTTTALLAGTIVQVVQDTFAPRGANALTTEEVQRAKNQLTANVMIALETKQIQLEELFKRVVAYEEQHHEHAFLVDRDYCDKIDAVTMADVKRVSEKMFTGPATIASIGDRDAMGDIRGVLQQAGLHAAHRQAHL